MLPLVRQVVGTGGPLFLFLSSFLFAFLLSVISLSQYTRCSGSLEGSRRLCVKGVTCGDLGGAVRLRKAEVRTGRRLGLSWSKRVNFQFLDLGCSLTTTARGSVGDLLHLGSTGPSAVNQPEERRDRRWKMHLFCGSRRWRVVGSPFTGESLPWKDLYSKHAVGVHIPTSTAFVLFDGGASRHQKPYICSGHGDVVRPAFHYGILPLSLRDSPGFG